MIVIKTKISILVRIIRFGITFNRYTEGQGIGNQLIILFSVHGPFLGRTKDKTLLTEIVRLYQLEITRRYLYENPIVVRYIG